MSTHTHTRHQHTHMVTCTYTHKVKELTKRTSRFERETQKAQVAERLALRKLQKAKKELQASVKLCDELRGFRKLYRDMAAKYPVMERQRDEAVGKVDELTNRATTAEQQSLKDAEEAQQAVRKIEKMKKKLQSSVKLCEELRASYKHPWLAVAKALDMSDADTRSISRGIKSMHDTLSNDWKESVSKKSQLTIRLPSIVRLLLKYLFLPVRVNRMTVPVEDIIDHVFQRDVLHNDIALQEIRKAVRSAVRITCVVGGVRVYMCVVCV